MTYNALSSFLIGWSIIILISTGVRSLQFKDNIISIGSGGGSVFFYDLRFAHYLTSVDTNKDEPCCLRTSDGWVVRSLIIIIYIHTYMTTCTCICTHVHIHVLVHMYMYIIACTHTHICMYMYIYVHV